MRDHQEFGHEYGAGLDGLCKHLSGKYLTKIVRFVIVISNTRPGDQVKLSTKGKYGVRAVFELARRYGKGPVTIKEIAKSQRISLSYLEQILYRLGRAGIVDSVRGPGGGVLLTKKPSEITIGDIVRALEGPIALSHCLEPGEPVGCYHADDCVARMVWAKVGARIEEALDSIKFDDLLRYYQQRAYTAHKKKAASGKGVC